MKEIVVSKNEAGQRMDKLLIKILCNASKSFIYKMIRKKNIVLNDKKVTGNEMLSNGDVIKVYFSDETYEKMTFSDRKDSLKCNNVKDIMFEKKVIYEDDNILIANKPSGILSQKAEKDDVSMNEYLVKYMLDKNEITNEQLTTFVPAFVNRLDRNTSGLIIAGKSLIGLQEMTRIIKERLADKYYVAIVSGKVTGKKQHIEGYLYKDEKSNKVIISDKQKKDSARIITEYETVKAGNDISLIRIKLITGKTHQIRAHLASIGHPVIGDYKYGSKSVNDYFKKKYLIKDQMLHSQEFVINEFLENDVLNIAGKKFFADAPASFSKVLKEMEKR